MATASSRKWKPTVPDYKVEQGNCDIERKVEELDLAAWVSEVEQYCAPNVEWKKKIGAFIAFLKSTTDRIGVTADFILTGSQSYFMVGEGSDIDIVMLDLSRPDSVNESLESHHHILNSLKDGLEEQWDGPFKLGDISVTTLMKVPCGMMTIRLDDPRIQIDICLDRMDGIILSRLLFYAKTQFHELQPMTVGIKLLCEKLKIYGTSNHYPDSCTLIVLALYYLQRRRQPIFGPVTIEKVSLPDAAAKKLSSITEGFSVDTTVKPLTRTDVPTPLIIDLISGFFQFASVAWSGLSQSVVIDVTDPSNTKKQAKKMVVRLENLEEYGSCDDDDVTDYEKKTEEWRLNTSVLRIVSPDGSGDNLGNAVPYGNWEVVFEAFGALYMRLANETGLEIKYKKARGSGINSLPPNQRIQATLQRELARPDGPDEDRIRELKEQKRMSNRKLKGKHNWWK